MLPVELHRLPLQPLRGDAERDLGTLFTWEPGGPDLQTERSIPIGLTEKMFAPEGVTFTGQSPEEVARHLRALSTEMKLPMAAVYEVASFYAHFDIVEEGEEAPPFSMS